MKKKKLEEQALQKGKLPPCPKEDSEKEGEPGVLLSDQIERYVEEFKLIDPLNPGNLKPAGYELTIGNDYALGGERKTLSETTNETEIKIPPFEVAIVSTRERVNLPRFLVGRWSLRVEWVYKGLLWVGAPQVDPGYVGYLFCPLYNLSNKDIVLKLGDPIALIDFVKTTSFSAKSKEYSRPPWRRDLGYYNYKLKSALFTEAGERIKKVEKEVRNLTKEIDNDIRRIRARVDTFFVTTFTAIAILVAALSILVTSAAGPSVVNPIWIYISFGLSIVAFSLACYVMSLVRRVTLSPAPSVAADTERRVKRLGLFCKVNSIVLVGLAVMIVLIILGKI